VALHRDRIVMKKMQPRAWPCLRGGYLTMVRRGRLGSSSSPPSSPGAAVASEPSGAASVAVPWAPAAGGS